MKNKVVEKLSSLLSDFINNKSDNSPMFAEHQESFENGFKQFIENLNPEMIILDLMMEICEKSLPPNLHDYWLLIARTLAENRSGMILENELKSLAEEAETRKLHNALEYLKLIAKDTGETPDMSDAKNILDI